jgi:hypothetical protein
VSVVSRDRRRSTRQRRTTNERPNAAAGRLLTKVGATGARSRDELTHRWELQRETVAPGDVGAPIARLMAGRKDA